MPAYCPVFLLLPSYVLKYLDSKHNYLDEILPPQKHRNIRNPRFSVFASRGAKLNSVFQSFLFVFLTGWRVRPEFPVFSLLF